MTTLKLGNKMKTIDVSNKPQKPARYRLFMQRGHDSVYQLIPIEMDDPIKQLRRITNLFEEFEGFENVTAVKCMDVETGVIQWELLIK